MRMYHAPPFPPAPTAEELAARAARHRRDRRADLAKAAMECILVNNDLLWRVDEEAPNDSTRVAVARYAYAIADAMLAEEEKS